MSSKKAYVIMGVSIILLAGYLLFFKNYPGSEKVFVFDNFHGSAVSESFRFSYPATWHNDGQYFSPEEIEYYDLFSSTAPFYFDLIRSDIIDQTEFYHQITASKRRSPDSSVKIGGRTFARYDLEDYGSYGGESAGHVIVYVGPEIAVGNATYVLVFHWEEKPLTEAIPGNDPAAFEAMVKSLTFSP